MKNYKTFLVFLLVAFSFTSCSSSDVDAVIAAIKQEVGIALDLNDLANLIGTDATNIVTFANGVSAANHYTEALIGDEVAFNINTNSASSLVRIADFSYASGDLDLWENGLEVVVDTTFANPRAYIKVLEGATAGQEVKFDIYFFVTANGIIDDTMYTIDPKIKIRTSR